MDIKPSDTTVKSLLETAFYKIPRFQRPYSWDQENVNEFWDDAIMSDDTDYFIGSFVLYRARTSDEHFFVVDGQQRLATITLLLAAVRDAFDSLGETGLADQVQKLIERKDINDEMRFVLTSETPYPYLQDHIQKRGAGRLEVTWGSEQRALRSAYEYLQQQVQDALTAADWNTTLTEKKKAEQKKTSLQRIRDQILRLQLITVQLGNEDDAYTIFETLNTRGKDLRVSDLVKTHLTRLIRPTNVEIDEVKDKWNSILELFDNSGADISVSRFLHHSWLSRYPYVTEKRLFKKMKHVIRKNNALEFLDSLTAEARLYRTIFEPAYREWSKEEKPISLSISALNLFRVVQPVPMTLSILREYDSGGIKLKRAKDVFRSMENFHLQFTAVTSQRTGGGTAKMYAAAARNLLFATTPQLKVQVLTEFIKKMRARIPGYQEFEADFLEIHYSEKATKQKPLVHYILRRIDESERHAEVVDYASMTIEHLGSQNPKGTPDVSPKSVGMIGNLILVPPPLNQKLANKAFKQKRAILKKAGFPLDAHVAGAASWTDNEVVDRTRALAKLCHERIFKV